MQVIATELAPKAIGPYSQAIVANGFVFCSGSIPLNPKTMEIVPGGIKEQTTQAIENMKAVLEASKSELSKIVKTTVFLKNMNDFSAMNEVYGQYLSHKPARSTVEVARLPKDVLFEIECIALLS